MHIVSIVDPCDSNQSQDDGVFHSSGMPCRVTGTYGVTYEKSSLSRKKAVVVDEETIIVDWVVVAFAMLVIFVTAVAAAVIGWRHKRCCVFFKNLYHSRIISLFQSSSWVLSSDQKLHAECLFAVFVVVLRLSSNFCFRSLFVC